MIIGEIFLKKSANAFESCYLLTFSEFDPKPEIFKHLVRLELV